MKTFAQTAFILVLFTGFCLLHSSYSQAAPRQQADIHAALDAYMAEQMERLKIPGAAVGVVQGDQVVYVQGHGKSDAAGRAVTPQTPFLLASVSKSFTALGIMQLVEAGQLDLDAPVQQYIPWFQVEGEGASTMTIRHLLHQTSGFSEVGGRVRNLEPNSPDALETSIRGLADESLNRLPGTGYEYSNTNYDVLGMIIQTVSGQPYDEYVKEHIFAPLEMNHSFTSLDEARANGMASGYYPFFGFPVVYDRFMAYTPAVLPSAGLISSAEDLSHYLIAHLNGGQYQDSQILSPAGVDTLHTPGVIIERDVGYAMGWVTFSFEEAALENEPVPTALTHTGSWVVFISNITLIPEKDTGVVVLMNTSDPLKESAYSRLGWDLALIAAGLEPVYFPAGEDFITQNGRPILGAAILLLGIENFLWMRRRQSGRLAGLWIGVSYLIDLALAGIILFILIPDNQTNLLFMLRFVPDVGLLYAIILILTLGWGTVRTFLSIWAERLLFAHRRL